MAFGVGDFIKGIFGQSQQESEFETVEDQDVTRSRQETQAGARTSETGQIQAGEFLSPEMIATLEQAMTQIAGSTGGFDLADALGQMALETPDVLNQQIDAIMNNARMRADQEISTIGTNLARSVGGSTGNSAVADLTARSMGDVLTNLAGQEGELRIGAQRAGLEALGQGVAGEGQAQESFGGSLAALATALKGATARTETQQTQNEVTQLLSALEELASGRTVRRGEEEGARQGSIFDVLRINLG